MRGLFMAQLLVAAALVLPLGSGCRGETVSSPPVLPLRNMHSQQRYDAQERSEFFLDGRTMRPPPPHTLAREVDPELTLSEGRVNDDSGYVLTIPEEVAEHFGDAGAVLSRGKERYEIYCRVCHDGTGAGSGTAVKRGMAQPPSLYEERLLRMPDGQLFATISNGIRNMPAYEHSIPVYDRWAIVSYVRALQVSQPGAGE
ncbi:MAG: cytochrome c [Myxococcales bacterium]|nr:cytochrome c [Myxococcales bacterium]